MKKKSSDDGLIYKTVERPAPQQQSAATMDPEQQKLWDLWVTRHIANAFAGRPTFCEAQSEALAYVIHKLRQEWRKEIGEKLAELRSDMMRNDSVLECWPRKKQHVA